MEPLADHHLAGERRRAADHWILRGYETGELFGDEGNNFAGGVEKVEKTRK